MTLGAAVLQNELSHRVPAEFLENFPQGVAIAYGIIPQIPSLQEPLKDGIQQAFADSLKVVWQVLIAVGAVGFLSSLLMKGLPLHGHMDKDWALQNDRSAADVERQGVSNGSVGAEGHEK